MLQHQSSRSRKGMSGTTLVALLALLAGVARTPQAAAQPRILAGTGMVILPSRAPASGLYQPSANGSRYKGPLDPDPLKRPQVQGRYEILAQESDVVAVHLVHIPNTDKYLYMERPSPKRSITRQIAGTLDLKSRRWTPVVSFDGLFCAGQTIDSEGNVIVAGGHKQTGGYPDGMRSVRILSQTKSPNVLVNATWMQWKRWYPTLTLLPDGKIMIMGGTVQVGGSGGGNKQYEIYDPQNRPNQYPLPAFSVEDTFYAQMKKMYYPFNFVLPTGDVYSFGERQARILVAQTGKYRQFGGWWEAGSRLEGTNFTQFPFTASAAYSTLTFEDNYSSVDLMLFGGAPVEAATRNDLLACRLARRRKISWTRSGSGWSYSFGNWQIEDMYIPRTMGDATLLPNGDVILLNGAQVGVAGDSATSGGSGGRSDYPAFWAQLYQPDRPVGQRFTMLAGSTIARMYHSVAALTTDATILVSGCDRCFRLKSDVPGWTSPTQRFEYRNEIFYPPYFFDTANKPKILSVSASTVGYNEDLRITWGKDSGSGSVPVTSVSIVAPSASTHSFNMNQRVVKLRITGTSGNTLTVRTPPHPYVAPPQYYMIFLMNGKTMSKAAWVKLVDKRGAGKVVPQ